MNRLRRKALLACMAVMLVLNAAAGHNGEPPPEPPKPPPPKIVPGPVPITILRWSWLAWWEANRSRFIWRHPPDPGVFLDPKDIDDKRQEARVQTMEALAEASRSPLPELRAASALAIGRMGAGTLLPRLEDLTQDAVAQVRFNATIGIGLLDTQDAQDALLGMPPGPLDQQLTRLAALALVTDANPQDPRLRDVVTRAMAAEERSAKRMGMFVVRCRPELVSARDIFELLLGTTDPWIASDAMLTLGLHPEAADRAVPTLRTVLLAGPEVENMPAWRDLSERFKARLATPNRAAVIRSIELARQWFALGPNRYADPGDMGARPFRFGIEPLYQARLRASAAIALGNLNQADGRQALVDVLARHDDVRGDLYKGFSLISLGKAADLQTLPALMSVLGRTMEDGRTPKRQEDLESPLRGYAAIGLGLYARSLNAVADRTRAVAAMQIAQALADRLRDKQETVEVRTACALALALMDHPVSLPLLQSAGAEIMKLADRGLRHHDEDMLLGWLLLARGMLGDQAIIDPAWRLLVETPDRLSLEGVAGRRAATLGLGLVGDGRAVRVLKKAWEVNYYVSQEASLALSLHGDFRVSRELIDMMKFSNVPLGKAFAADSLGYLFADRRPPRTAWFISGSNYMMRSDELRPYMMLGNEFLYRFLIGAYGDQWW